MRCDSCGAEMTSASPFAEFWYWQSDGVGGFVSFCAGCARRTQDARAQAAAVIDERPAAERADRETV
jgi:hypothetical protein